MFDCSQAADNRRREVVMKILCIVSTLVRSLLCLTEKGQTASRGNHSKTGH